MYAQEECTDINYHILADKILVTNQAHLQNKVSNQFRKSWSAGDVATRLEDEHDWQEKQTTTEKSDWVSAPARYVACVFYAVV